MEACVRERGRFTERPARYRVPVVTPLEVVRAQAEEELACLTNTEVEVLVYLAKGTSSKVIAYDTGRAEKTIEGIRKTLTRRLGMTYVEAAVLAGKAGWV